MIIDKNTPIEDVEGILIIKLSELLTERREEFLNYYEHIGSDHVHHNLCQQFHGVEYTSIRLLDELFPDHKHYFALKENPRRVEGGIYYVYIPNENEETT